MANDEIKRIQERYKLEEQINKAIKENTKSINDYVDAQKQIVENYKLAQQLEKQINELKKIGTKEALKEVKILEAQREQLIAINKELSSFKNLAKAAGNEIIGWGKQLVGNFMPNLSDVFQTFLKIDNLAHQTANTLGFQGAKLGLMRDNITLSRDEFVGLGFEIEDAYAAQTALSDETGRQVMLTREAAKTMAQTARITGMAVEGVSQLAGQMDLFGLGAEESTKFILEMSKEASEMGLNSGKVIKSFQQNLNLLNKLNFKNGVAGLKAMTKFSEKYKIDMQAVASVADKVFRPEGAIEAAAQLQVLGGDLAALGDPFQLMYKARNSPEELAKSLTKAATASATFNEKTGEFEVNAYELDRLREAAQALGMDYSQLVETAKQGAKIKKFEGLLGGKGLDKETMEALTGAAQMGKKGAYVTIKGDKVYLKDMTASQAELFKRQEENNDKLAEDAMSIQNDLTRIKNEIMVSLVKLFEKIEPMLKSAIDGLRTIAKGFIGFIQGMNNIFGPAGTLGILLGLYFGAKAAFWYLNGKIMGAGFNSVTMGKNGLGGTVSNGAKDFLKNQRMSTTGGTGGMTGTQMGMQGIAQKNAGLGAKAAGLGDMYKSLGSAAQILAVGAALMMLAKALDIFADAMIKLQQVPAGLLAGVATGLLIFVGAMGALGASGIGEIGVAIMLGVGAALLMIGGAVFLAATGMSILVDSFTKMFDVIGPNGDSIMKAGLGFGVMAIGLGVLSYALIGLSASALLAVVGLGVILGLTTSIVAATTSLNSVGGAEGITKAVDAINKVDTEKLDSLKSLSKWMALLGGTTTIKFDEDLKIDGSIEITGSAGGKKDTDWVNDPIFVSKLKSLIENSKVGDRNQKL